MLESTSLVSPNSAPAPPPTSSSGLSRRRKAAVIVQLLIGDGGSLALSELPPALQAQLARELGDIRVVDRTTVNLIASEFADQLGAIGLSAPGGYDAAIDALAQHISPEIANQLRADLAKATDGNPWTMIQALDQNELMRLMTIQSVEVSAVTLSKLPVDKAAELLSNLPGERARSITYEMSKTEDIPPAMVHRIGQALVGDHCGSKATAFDKTPDARLGAILNSSPAKTREALLAELENQDSKFAAHVRNNIFTFEDIETRVAALDVPQCIRGVDAEVLTTAIAAALGLGGKDAEAAEYLLANISKRMSEQVREEAEELGAVSEKDGDNAMRAVSSSILALADEGTITLITEENMDS